MACPLSALSGACLDLRSPARDSLITGLSLHRSRRYPHGWVSLPYSHRGQSERSRHMDTLSYHAKGGLSPLYQRNNRAYRVLRHCH